MRHTKRWQIFSLVFIFVLLLAFLPEVPVQAQTSSITLNPTTSSVGNAITVTGANFTASTDTTERNVAIYLSNQQATVNQLIGTSVTIYEVVDTWEYVKEDGTFQTTFNIPTLLNDGSTSQTVTSGTYYVYVLAYQVGTTTLSLNIKALATLTVVAGTITLDPKKGPVGTEVEVTGTNFSSNQTLTMKYDTSTIDIEDGDTKTDSNGKFVSTIVVPESTAGAQTIAAVVAGNEVTAQFTVEPEAVLSPTSGSANSTVTVKGTGFGRRKEVVIYFKNVGLATVTADTKGSFTITFNVPDVAAGIYNVEAEDDDENLDTAKFTVTAPPPPATPPPTTPTPPPPPPPPTTSASISQTSGPIGADIVMGGAGFKANAAVTIKFDDQELAKVTADSKGIFVAAFKIPASKHGDHKIIASDGTSQQEFTFTIESEKPPIPAPLAPAMGVRVEPPLFFDWKEVTDVSLPVTYTFQIASDPNFTAGSIVLEKKGLTSAEYTLTESEVLKLTSLTAPYFWRVRAVDGAANEGDWTGPGQFYLAQPFALPKWAWYTLAGLGGLFIFIIGYWLGRRSAYY